MRWVDMRVRAVWVLDIWVLVQGSYIHTYIHIHSTCTVVVVVVVVVGKVRLPTSLTSKAQCIVAF